MLVILLSQTCKIILGTRVCLKERLPKLCFILVYEPVHEKTNNLHMRKQRRRPASR